MRFLIIILLAAWSARAQPAEKCWLHGRRHCGEFSDWWPGFARQSGRRDDKKEFTLTRVLPGSYHLQVSVPKPFYVKQSMIGGRVIADEEVTIGSQAVSLEIVLSDEVGIVEGDVAAATGSGAVFVILQREGSLPKFEMVDESGHFTIDRVPPGEYRVDAWDADANVEYRNPEWMRLNAKSTAVSVTAGETTRVQLTRQLAPAE